MQPSAARVLDRRPGAGIELGPLPARLAGLGGVKYSPLEARVAGAGNMIGHVRDAYLQCLKERLCSRASRLHGETIERSITEHRKQLQLTKVISSSSVL